MEHLLFTGDYNKSESEIKEKGGRITHRLSEHVFIAHLLASSCSCILKHSSPQPLVELDEKSSMMIRAWKKLRATEEPVSPGWMHVKPGQPEWFSKTSLQNELEPVPPITGQLAVGIVIISGSSGGWQFTDEENIAAITMLLTACEFLSQTGGNLANLSFSYDIYTLTINSMPNMQCTSYEGLEALFRDPALQQMGYGYGQAGVIDFTTDVARRNNASRGFATFITKYPMFKPFYATGPKFCFNYQAGAATIAQQFVYCLAEFFGTQYEGNKYTSDKNLTRVWWNTATIDNGFGYDQFPIA